MPEVKKKQSDFSTRGVDLNASTDHLREGYYPYLHNVRRHSSDVLTPRHGLGTGSPVMSAQTPLHSARRINDSSTGTTASALVTGAGTHLGICAADLSAHASSDSGFSGDPLSICIHRPAQSTKPFAYVADRSRMRKIDQAGADKQIGLPHPASPPSAVLAAPSYKVLNEFNDHTEWTAGGTAAGKANHTRIDSATRTVTAILYDSGNTGWACVRPSSMENIGAGMRITVDAETTVVQTVRRGSASTTIAAVIYESGGGTGLCSIHLATPIEDIDIDSMVRINAAEYVRVLSVHRTHDGQLSFRCSTVAGFTGGESVQAFSSFRAYFTSTHVATDTISAAGVEFTVATGTGYISRTVALDLSQIATGIPTRPQDFMHLDVYVDKPELVSEIKMYLDIDATSNTFDRNYFLYVIRASDLTPLTKDEQTLLDNERARAQRETLQDEIYRQIFEGAESSKFRAGEGRVVTGLPDEAAKKLFDDRRDVLEDRQFNAGQNQWSSMKWRIMQLVNKEEGRIGADQSRGLKDVAALRISVISSGAVTVRVDGWWIGGGFDADVTTVGRPRIYRYRGLDSTTGVVGNWSPALQGGVSPMRQKVNVSFTQHPSSECDKLEVQVYGGDRLGWCYAETIENSATPTMEDVFSDEFLELRKAVSEQSDNHYQLWPQIRPPDSGSGANMAGNLVNLLGFGSIDASTALGTSIRVGSRNYTINQMLSTTKFYTAESGGVQTGVDWDVPEPLLVAQPLPVLAGPYFGFFLGCGDKYNPWRYYYTNGQDCDSTRGSHYGDLDGHILQNFVILEELGRAVLFSTETAFSFEPTFTLAQTGGNLFTPRGIPDAPGLFARWACCDADGEAVWLSRDGIYATNGGGVRCISTDLRTIFPKGDEMGVTTNGVVAPNMTAANASKIRLSYSNRELWFDYIGLDGNYHSLTNERGPNDEWLGWIPSTYSPGVTVHHGEEGEGVNATLACGADGKLYRLDSAQGDAGGSLIAAITTPDQHCGDPRRIKHIMESMLDCDRDGATVTATVGYNHRATTPDSLAISAGSGRAQNPIDLDSGRGRDAKDVSLAIVSTVTTERPKLYAYEFVYSERFDSSLLRATDYDQAQPGVLWARGIWIYADTAGLSREAVFEFTRDDGTTGSITVSNIVHSELGERYYTFASPQYVVAARVRPTDADSWEFGGFRIDGEPAPPLSDGPTQKVIDGMQARYVQGLKLDIDTANALIDMGVNVDEGVLQTTISAAANKGPVQANGRAIKHYTFDAPFITHLIELNPSAACRIWGIEVISEPEPELAWMWWAQQNDLGLAGYKILGDGWITVRSTSNIVLELIADGTSYLPTFYDASTNTAGARRKLHFRCPPMKLKSVEPKVYAATAAGRVAVYQKEFQLEFKPFGFEGSWQVINLLGDAHYQHGARI